MKFAQIGYGSDGRGTGKTEGEGYTYLVNDNVRKEQVMQVIATSRNGRAFPTTGKVLTADKNAPKAPDGSQVVIPENKQDNLTEAYTQKELGVRGGFGKTKLERQEEARYNALAIYNKEKLGGLTGEEAAKKLAITGGTKTERLMKDGYESYADYIERTKPWGDNQ